MKRTTRFYRKNEREVMERLGFHPTINSGSGDIQKEDGENDIAICQLKSTDAHSISINQNDLHVLEYHAAVSHKVPVFAIQFLNTDEVWLCMRPADVQIVVREKVDIFEEKEQKTVDKKRKTMYNKNESREARKTSQAREEYNKRRAEERKQYEEVMKARRRGNRWKKSLNNEESQSTKG